MKKISVSICIYLWLISLLLFVSDADAQVRPVNDYGAIGLAQLLKRLNTTASVMMIGAHPDDEDSALLAYLARGENARTAYLSLTRGDGGQNIIGPELFESLGVIRTEELLQARRLDGAEQYFTRAFDYGFSKSLEEAKSKWDEKVILCDTVRAIRLFRPLVVISRFSGTPADGHGQHQYAGYISPIAVKAAADPKQCTQSGEAWTVLKFYVEQGFSAGDTAQLKLNTGAYDPILGRSYFEIAMEGRSQHRSQGEGRLEYHGDQFSGVNLKESRFSNVADETSIFDGIDKSTSGIDDSLQNADTILSARLEFLDSILVAVKNEGSRARQLSDLINGYVVARKAISSTLPPAVKIMVFRKNEELIAAIRLVAGLQIDALGAKETVVPGDDLATAVKVYYPKTSGVTLKDITLKAANGWIVTKGEAPKDNNQGFLRETASSASYFNVKVAADAKPTQPYWLEEQRTNGLFAWPKGADQTLPFSPQLVIAEVKVEIDGTEITLTQPVQYRYADPARGEIRRDLNVVPSLSVSMGQKLLVVSESDKPQTKRVVMNITNNSSQPITGHAGLNIVGGEQIDWKYSADQSTFSLTKKGEKATVGFDVIVPAKTKTGTYTIYGNAMVGESHATQTMNTIEYPHIQTHRFYTRAETKVEVLDLKVAPVKVGYVMGSGDEVADSIRKMGLDVTMLEEKDLASGDLAKFGTIVVGIRAYETRPDLIANNQRLLEYVKNGGNLIVQYQRGHFGKGGLAPFPFDSEDKQKTTAGSIARVVDENAAVTILAPSHPALNSPNKIGSDDFKGWVQERNAYNLVTFDQQYIPLLESHDAGEQPNKGGLVVATVGKGNWVYCSYSMFRQLPAGVPGAYRLFANLLSLPKPGPDWPRIAK